MLQPYKRLAAPGHHVRIRRLEERLRRFPVPTGLVREVEKIIETSKAGDRSGARERDSVDLMPMVQEIIKALQAVALVVVLSM